MRRTMYVSAQALDSLDLAKSCLFPNQKRHRAIRCFRVGTRLTRDQIFILNAEQTFQNSRDLGRKKNGAISDPVLIPLSRNIITANIIGSSVSGDTTLTQQGHSREEIRLMVRGQAQPIRSKRPKRRQDGRCNRCC